MEKLSAWGELRITVGGTTQGVRSSCGVEELDGVAWRSGIDRGGTDKVTQGGADELGRSSGWGDSRPRGLGGMDESTLHTSARPRRFFRKSYAATRL
jgi:hypothetical protein